MKAWIWLLPLLGGLVVYIIMDFILDKFSEIKITIKLK